MVLTVMQEAMATYQTRESEVAEDVNWILNQVQQQELTIEEAEQCLDEILKSAPKPETDTQGAHPPPPCLV